MKYIQPKGVTASGPYSCVVAAPPWVFISGQGSRDPETGEKYLGEFRRQAELAMANLKRCVEAADISMDDLVKVTVYLADIRDLAAFNDIYPEFFENKTRLPTRTTVAVSGLPGGMSVEIDAIALAR